MVDTAASRLRHVFEREREGIETGYPLEVADADRKLVALVEAADWMVANEALYFDEDGEPTGMDEAHHEEAAERLAAALTALRDSLPPVEEESHAAG